MKRVLIFALFLGFSALIKSQAQSQGMLKASDTLQTPEGTRIRVIPLQPNSEPPSRGARDTSSRDTTLRDSTRVVGCDMKLENWTTFVIDVYVDGYYRCTLSPKTYLYVVVEEGYRSIEVVTATACSKREQQFIVCSESYTFRFYWD